MDPAKREERKRLRDERLQQRIIDRLAEAGPEGLRRAKLINAISHNDYRAGAEALERAVVDRVVEWRSLSDDKPDRPSYYRLSDRTVEELAVTDPEKVAAWFDFTNARTFELRERRLQRTGGEDVLVPADPDAEPVKPPYHKPQPEVEVEYRVVVSTPPLGPLIEAGPATEADERALRDAYGKGSEELATEAEAGYDIADSTPEEAWPLTIPSLDFWGNVSAEVFWSAGVGNRPPRGFWDLESTLAGPVAPMSFWA